MTHHPHGHHPGSYAPDPARRPRSNAIVRLGGAGLVAAGLAAFAAIPFPPWRVPDDDRYINPGPARSWLELLASGNPTNIFGPGAILLCAVIGLAAGIAAVASGRALPGYLGLATGLLAGGATGITGFISVYFALDYGPQFVMLGSWIPLAAGVVFLVSAFLCLVGALKTRHSTRPSTHRRH